MPFGSKHNQVRPAHSRSDGAAESNNPVYGKVSTRCSITPCPRLPMTPRQVTRVATVF